MSTTNLSPHFKGLGQQMTTAVEESLQGVEVEIQELKQKIKVAWGKPRPTYQEQLENLCHAEEALQEALVGLREERTARAPSPLTFPQAIPRP